ncbi:hypothetical protein ACLIYP_24115 [Streptomyces nanhaiensis]|uniref:hypothetical protein n=1 Tax=Streptomyces nanhaiensis TaxID=679319 RepID=UPI00399CFE92
MRNGDKDRVCAERVRGLDEWTREMDRDVVRLAEMLDIRPPEELLSDPRTGLAKLDALYEYEDIEAISEEDTIWVTAQLLAYVATYLIKKFDGRWVVDTDRGSPSYARYLVALPAPRGDGDVLIDIGKEVDSFLHEPVGRSLLKFIIRLEGKVAP